MPLVLCGLALTGCASAPQSLQQCTAVQDVPLVQRAGVEIAERADESALPKLVVVEPGAGSSSLAQRAHLGQSVAGALRQAVAQRGVELIDSGTLPPVLAQQLRTAEALGTSTYQGPQVANFAFVPEVTMAEYDAPFQDALRVPIKGELVTVVPAQFKHRAQVRLNIRIVEMPSMKLLRTVRASGEAKESDGGRARNDETGATLMRRAAADAVQKARDELLQMFKRRGQVVARRDCRVGSFPTAEEHVMLLISMGSEQGLAAGDQIEIYLEEEFQAPGVAPRMDRKLLASATVTSDLREHDAWVRLSRQAASKVRGGDFVAVTYAARRR
ncbi:hypothetical protein [Ideonella livida]|uniref:Flagellar assembly protein T C-terminal domain-containing protein n=1 Tax=Ideonella livida TaxID=2707176 RepID=A0A7C9PGT2_9BURK|nr:hypothetical protein [Ideonella livida]NDY90654.1 hypothetical protein [Ideonella livida]